MVQIVICYFSNLVFYLIFIVKRLMLFLHRFVDNRILFKSATIIRSEGVNFELYWLLTPFRPRNLLWRGLRFLNVLRLRISRVIWEHSLGQSCFWKLWRLEVTAFIAELVWVNLLLVYLVIPARHCLLRFAPTFKFLLQHLILIFYYFDLNCLLKVSVFQMVYFPH